VNAVLVAPQFAVNAADSSAGKFWEPNGFKRFLDEAAIQLARMYGDPRSAFTFASTAEGSATSAITEIARPPPAAISLASPSAASACVA
jgi:hypothetical protein